MDDPIHGSPVVQFRSMFRSFVLDQTLILARVIDAQDIARIVTEEVGKTCDRIFTPMVVLAVFLAQVLDKDHSCRGALSRLLAWRVARGLPACSPDTGGYCKARKRL